MKVRAVAVGTERSNAIGTVELECTPHGLSIVYLGVGSFTVGYAPGALTVGTHVLVPWRSVAEARVEGDRIFLAIDPDITPHNRLTMTSFSTGENPHRRELDRQRSMLRIGAVGAALVTALLVAVSVPLAAPRAGAFAALVIGALSAGSILAIGLFAERRLGRGGVEGDAAREALAVELSAYLPNFVRLPSAPMPPLKPITVPAFQAFLPRTTFAIVITMTACSLGALLVAGSVLRARDQSEARRSVPREPPLADEEQEPQAVEQPAQPVSRAPAAAAASVQPPSPATSAAAAQSASSVAGRCTCRRADLLFWQKPIPILSTLILSQKVHHELRRKRTELELAAVNNGDKDVNELTIVIQFFDRDPAPSLRRYDVGASSVYFQGPLGPGKAIKWSIEARGSEFEVQPPMPGDIGPVGDGAAPTNMLADLLEANHRPVRLHGAMMLAFLGDARAKEAVMKLREALREEEAPYLDRVATAVGDVRVCALEVKGAGALRKVKLCAFNASDAPRPQVVVRVRALESMPTHADPVGTPPAVLAETSFTLPGELPSHAGAELRGDFHLEREEPVNLASSGAPASEPPRSAPVFEAFAE